MKQEPAKRIVLGLTGGIAAYKAAELARLLVKQGMEVQVVMTEAACHFIAPATMQALTGRAVLVKQWDAVNNGMAHIDTSRAADAILIAPATADFIAKLAHGLADDLLSTLCLRARLPAAGGAGDEQTDVGECGDAAQCRATGCRRRARTRSGQRCAGMWRRRHGAHAGGGGIGLRYEAYGVPALSQRERGLAGRWLKVLITAGPTYEAIDAVRGITNRSSGKMGYAVAQAALELGAHVTLISGPVAPQAARRAGGGCHQRGTNARSSEATCRWFRYFYWRGGGSRLPRRTPGARRSRRARIR